ncbi:RDD family protein [Cellulomonas edaphi]|uniref:RDD family protein n=1 Tax=Cellulomonas edaphi TaxID=3053468 RepID=A0ABT7S750_9CELL|nr:RDD family protein [Cellulomons edaphi]MDM7831451.1 RDD family protein [Cellulomons edaphi]
MADRRDLSSWLDGGASDPDPSRRPAESQARGQRLGLPASGSGSLASLGRRFAALAIDWVACLLIAGAFFPVDREAFFLTRGSTTATLGIFALENVLLVGSIGHTLGHRLVGLRVRRVIPTAPAADQERLAVGAPGFIAALLRTLLLCLVIPAVVWDPDGRGLHDRAAGTAIVRR